MVMKVVQASFEVAAAAILGSRWPLVLFDFNQLSESICCFTDYGCPVRKSPLLHGQKSNPTPKLLGTAEAYFVCHIVPNFQISLIYAFNGCPSSVTWCMEDGCMIRKWPTQHSRELHPKRLVTAEAYLSATFGPNISDFFDSSFHLVSVVRE